MKQPSLILRLAIPTPLWKTFDYLPPEAEDLHWQPGMRLKVPFGRRELVGVLIAIDSQSGVARDKLKSAIKTLDTKPILSKQLLTLLSWVSDYYQYPIGEVFSNALPKRLRSDQKHNLDEETKPLSAELSEQPSISLNEQQRKAVENITETKGFGVFLLHGVTGSGKTEVYLRAIDHVLKQGKQALVLVPEISLTPQTISRFEKRFSKPIVMLHSNLTDKQRAINWLKAREESVGIVIGTRSAVFAPLPKLGIIVLDEEHDTSFKQQSRLRYCARNVAVMRAHLEKIPIVLGSATPCLESLSNVVRKRYRYLSLPQRAGNAKMPTFTVLDMRKQTLQEGLSETLLKTMKMHLAKQGQVLLFLNRRGYAPVLICHQCGWIATCLRCDAKLTLHQKPAKLICHHCEYQQAVIHTCQQCKQRDVMPLGLGTERLETFISAYFPHETVLRIDRDTTRAKGSMQAHLAKAHNREANILIGTQMMAKGHHFPQLSLVAIVDVDNGLFSTDFRALERMAQTIMQVSGRAGRGEEKGEVILQTHQPDHPLLQLLIQQGYNAFAKALLEERKAVNFPPFSYQALFRVEAKSQKSAMQFLQQAKQLSQANSSSKEIQYYGPIPALMERKAGYFQVQLLLQAQSRVQLQKQLSALIPKLAELPNAKRLRWSLDVDPQEI